MTHDIFALMADRRSTKRFSPQPVEMDKLLQVVQAGALAPSSGNIQNWSFVVVTDTDKIRALYHHSLDQEAFLSAMAAIVVCGDVEYAHSMYGMRGKRLYTIQNCAAAMQNMLLAAHALSLGAVWIGAFDEDKVCAMFELPPEQRPQAILLFGYPDYDAEPKELKPLQSLVFFNQYGNRVLRPHLVFFDWASEWRHQAQKVKSHVAYAKESVFGKGKHEAKETQEPVHENKQKSDQHENSEKHSPIEQTKKHILEAFEHLKKDEYK